MRFSLRPLLLLVFLAGSPVFAQVQGSSTGARVEEQAIRRLIKDFELAWQRGDASALARLWAEESDLGLLGSAPRTRGRAEHERGFAEAFSRRTREISRHMEIVALRFVLPDAAVVDGAFHYGAGQTPGGETISARREPFVAVIVRKDEGWAFAAGRSGPIVPISPRER